MAPLRRHQLAYPRPSAWQAVLEQAWDYEAHKCLRHWAAQGLPLVVTRQPVAVDHLLDGLSVEPAEPCITLGLSAPPVWGRRLVTLRLPMGDIGWFGEFPLLERVIPELPFAARSSLQALSQALAVGGVRAQAFGSVGWQHLSGLRYRHAASDLDLWVGVESPTVADHVAAALQQHAPPGMKLDGELVFPDGGAVAWREWAAWRAGRSKALLVKRLHGVGMECQAFAEPSPMPWRCAARRTA